VGPRAKREYLAQMRDRYVRAQTRQARGVLLTEAMAVTGYHRKALIRARRRPVRRPAPGQPRRGRRCHYTAATVRALKAVWTAAGYPWSVRLKALLPTINARQMDRVLSADKRRRRRRQYGGTPRGSRRPRSWGKARSACRPPSSSCGSSCRSRCAGLTRIMARSSSTRTRTATARIGTFSSRAGQGRHL